MAPKKNAEEIFNKAVELSNAAEQAEYLDQACAGDEKLRTEVEALLNWHTEAGDFLEVPPVDPNPTTPTSAVEGSGTVIGRYKLLEKVGEGGMATVYMAEQKRPIRRRVALKIIKLGMDTQQVIARFEAERQALAMMDHPNIAKVFDAGATETGRPYFVMELVRGVPITEYCDQQKLRTRERLDLFLQVCNAVQHAHQKGIIHRDLKPSNVLVTLHNGRPIAVVIDFGIAKATNQQLTEQTLFTRYAQMIGTPEYMSPEQAQMSHLDVDTRTDIYSLGVLLYELLTGTTPFQGDTLRDAGYAEIQRIIQETQPPKPSTRLSSLADTLPNTARYRQTTPELLRKTVKGDLDWIVMKSMDKDRTRRYETAHALAEDIERHLRDEPILAGAPGTVERCRKFVRRHRALVTGLAAVLVVLLFGIIGMTAFAYRANCAREEAEIIAHFLERDVFGSLDPWDGQVTRPEELFDIAAARLDAGYFRDRPRIEARLCKTVGTALHRFNRLERAELFLQRALELYRRQRGDCDPETLSIRIELGYLYFFWSRPDKGEPIMVQTLADCRRVFGDRDPNTLAAMSVLGSIHMYLGQPEAEPLLHESWETARRELGAKHKDTLLYGCALGVLRWNQGELDEAERLLAEALEDPQHGPRHHRFEFMATLAMVYLGQEQQAKAESWAQRTLRESIQSLGEAHPDSIYARQALAHVRDVQNRPDEAETLLKEAIEIRRENPDQTGWTIPSMTLAGFYARHGRHDKMARQVAECRARYEPDTDAFGGELAMTFNNLAWLLATHPDAEVRHGELAVEYATQACAWTQYQNANWIDTLAAALAERGDFEDAVERQQQAIDMVKVTDTEEEPDVLGYEKRLRLYKAKQPYREEQRQFSFF